MRTTALCAGTCSRAIDRRAQFTCLLFNCLFFLALTGVWAAAQAATTQYYYDDLGRIVQAIRSDGSVRQYQYDANGNVLAINVTNVSGLSISGLSPSTGHVGATVTVLGTGFSTTPGQNDVRFGGIAAAAVTSATATTLVVTVPEGAVTGPITVTTGGHSATSPTAYIVRKPAIDSVSPAFVAVGGTVTLTGSNLNLVPGGTTVSVGSVAGTISSITNSRIVFAAPNNSGLVTVNTPYGQATSAASVAVVPDVVGLGNVTSFAQAVPNAGVQNLSIGQAGRYAVLAVNASVGQLYTLKLSGYDTVPADTTIILAVYSPDNSVLQYVGIGSSTSFIDLPQIPASGTYLLAFSSSASSVQLGVNTILSPELHADGISVSANTTSVGEHRRYSLQATAGDDLGLALTGLSTAAYAVAVYVKRLDGTVVNSVLCFTGTTPGCPLTLRDLPVTGFYSIEVFPAESATLSMNATLTLSTDVAGPLVPGVPLTVNLAVPGQNGLLTFTVTQGQNVAINLGSVVTAPAGNAIYMTVYDSAGNYFQSTGTNPATLNLPNLAAGTYSVLLAPDRAATAIIQVSAAIDTTQAVPTDASTTTFTTTVPGQNRYFSFNGTAGQNVGIALTNIVGTPADSSLFVYVDQPSGANLTSFTCYSFYAPGCQIGLRNIPETGAYRVRVEVADQVSLSFALTVSQHLTGALALDTPYSLNLAVPGRQALLTFAASAGQTVALNLNSFSTTPANTYVELTVFDPSGTRVGTSSSTTNPIVNLPDLSVGGTYTVLVNTVNGSTATMQVVLASGIAGALPVDGSSHSFASTVNGQQGYFAFSATAGQNVGIAMTNLVITPSTTSAAVEVYRPDGGLLVSNICNPGSQPGCQWSLRDLPATGTYRIIVAPYITPEETMSFTLTVSEHLSGALVLDTPYSLSLNVPGKYALLTFTASAGQTVALNANAFTTTPAGKAVNLTLLDSAGTQIGSPSSDATNPILNLPNMAAGTYSVLVSTVDAATANVQVTLATGVTGVLPVNGTSSSFAATVKGQLGYFTFSGIAGQDIGWGLTNLVVPGTIGVFDIYTLDGGFVAELACNPASLPGCQRNVRNLPVTGTYKMIAAPYSATVAAPMSYTLTLSQFASGVLTTTTPYNFAAAPGQHALLTFTVTAGQSVVVKASGVATRPAGNAVQLTVFNPAGGQIGSASDATNPTVSLTNLTAGTYSVLVNTVDASTATAQVTLQ